MRCPKLEKYLLIGAMTFTLIACGNTMVEPADSESTVENNTMEEAAKTEGKQEETTEAQADIIIEDSDATQQIPEEDTEKAEDTEEAEEIEQAEDTEEVEEIEQADYTEEEGERIPVFVKGKEIKLGATSVEELKDLELSSDNIEIYKENGIVYGICIETIYNDNFSPYMQLYDDEKEQLIKTLKNESVIVGGIAMGDLYEDVVSVFGNPDDGYSFMDGFGSYNEYEFVDGYELIFRMANGIVDYIKFYKSTGSTNEQ